MGMKKMLMGLLCAGVIMMTTRAEALVIISEFLADPAPGLAGDANADGTVSSREDEFVELFNTGSSAVDLGGWEIADGYKTRHIFAEGDLLPAESYLVVFGGGVPALPDGVTAITASSGGLGLNNSGDVIRLWERGGVLADEVNYGREGGQDESLIRDPQLPSGAFVLHSEVDTQKRLFSPGSPVDNSAPVPEPGTLALMLSGGLSLVVMRRKERV
ncbi:MAG: lamin tail domain-containing protein [Candidatus Omnitrophota bacterium]